MIITNDLKRQYDMFSGEYENKVLEVLRSGWYVLGPEVESFEKEWSNYIGSKYCVGVGSGLDALYLSLRILGVGSGDEVIVSSNAYIACVMAITMNGATPVFVEPDEYYNMDHLKIEEAISNKTKAILAVHLYGNSCNMSEILKISNKYNLYVIEDCAQSHGNSWENKKVGTFGTIGCFSFYPTKGCGAFGDGGCIVTNDKYIYEQFKMYRNYGSKEKYINEVVGVNSRLDEIQAGLLRVKLSHLDELNNERNCIADRYTNEIINDRIILPKLRPGSDSSWHQYVVRIKNNRDDFAQYLLKNNIKTLIHYPIPPHLSKAYEYLGYRRGDFPLAESFSNEVLSLPIYNGMTFEEQNYVINVINNY